MPKIRLLESYQGERTGGRMIPPGVYDVNDPLLYNGAGYLLRNRWAVVVEEAGEPEAPAAPPSTIDPTPAADDRPDETPAATGEPPAARKRSKK